MEAADTLTYHIVDYEDCCKLGFLNSGVGMKNLAAIVNNSKDPRCRNTDWKSIPDKDEKFGALRAKVINALIYECIEVFKDNYTEIMCGAFDEELTDVIPSASILKRISNEDIKQHYHRHTSVLDNELIGFEVIFYLLELVTDCIKHPEKERNKKLKHKLPKQFSDVLFSKSVFDYKKLLVCSDFISRMTDGYALSLFRN